jgi:hypothetical protein
VSEKVIEALERLETEIRELRTLFKQPEGIFQVLDVVRDGK